MEMQGKDDELVLFLLNLKWLWRQSWQHRSTFQERGLD